MVCTFTNTDSFLEHTGNTQYRIMTYIQVPTNDFITTTGSALRPARPTTGSVYDRLGKIPLNTLEIHGTVL